MNEAIQTDTADQENDPQIVKLLDEVERLKQSEYDRLQTNLKRLKIIWKISVGFLSYQVLWSLFDMQYGFQAEQFFGPTGPLMEAMLKCVSPLAIFGGIYTPTLINKIRAKMYELEKRD